MESGTIVSFNREKHYGFIKPDAGSTGDVMLHDKELCPGEDAGLLRRGARVSYEGQQTARGPRAVNVRVIGEAPAAVRVTGRAGFPGEAHAIFREAEERLLEAARRHGMAG